MRVGKRVEFNARTWHVLLLTIELKKPEGLTGEIIHVNGQYLYLLPPLILQYISAPYVFSFQSNPNFRLFLELIQCN